MWMAMEEMWSFFLYFFFPEDANWATAQAKLCFTDGSIGHSNHLYFVETWKGQKYVKQIENEKLRGWIHCQGKQKSR